MTAAQPRTRLRRGCARLAWIPLVAAASCSGFGQQQAPPAPATLDHLAGPPVTLHSGGAQALNVVILGDGFTQDADSMQAYRDAADEVVTSLLAAPPFGALTDALTIYRVDVFSDEAGIDVPQSCGGLSYNPSPTFKWSRSAKNPDNILGTSWCAASAAGEGAKKSFLGSTSPNVELYALSAGVVPDITIVLVNDWMFGATAYPQDGVTFVSICQNLVGDLHPATQQLLTPNDPEAFPSVSVHEIGHLAPFLLLDEYSKGRPQQQLDTVTQGIIDASPNLTTMLAPLKWQSLVAAGTPVPTDCAQTQPDAGAVEGGFGFDKNVYHAACAGKMDFWEEPFCIVCRQRILDRLGWYLSPLPSAKTAWVVLDSLTVGPGVRGLVSINYRIELVVPSPRPGVPAETRVREGRWPPNRPAPLETGEAAMIGLLAATLSVDHVPAAPAGVNVTFSYELRRWHRPEFTPDGGSVVAGQSLQVPWPVPSSVPGRGTGTILRLDQPTHRLTVGLIVR